MNSMNYKFSPVAVLVVTAITSTSTFAKEEEKQSSISNSSVMIVTAPVDSPLMISTSPKTPRQPVPASDGSDYLKTIPAFLKFVMVARMVTLFSEVCLALALKL